MRVNTGIPDCLFLTKRLNFWFLMYTQLADIPVITIQLETLIAKHPYTLHCLQRIRLCLGLSDPTISTAVLYPWQIRMLTQSPLGTALHNHIRIVFDDMSSWTHLTICLGMKTTFYTKYIQSKYVRTFITRI